MQALRALALPRRGAVSIRSWALQAQRGMAAQAAPAPAEDLIEVTVDGKKVHVPKGSNVIQACDAAGVDVPRLVTRGGAVPGGCERSRAARLPRVRPRCVYCAHLDAECTRGSLSCADLSVR